MVAARLLLLWAAGLLLASGASAVVAAVTAAVPSTCENDTSTCVGTGLLSSCVATWCPSVTTVELRYPTASLSGSIPASVGSLALKWRFELLDQASVTGSIPPSLGSLSDLLSKFILANAQLSGTVPSSLGSLRSLLGDFALDTLPLTGTIPPSISSLGLYSAFVLEHVGLTGTIPESLGLGLSNLRSFFLVGFVPLSGSLPSSLGSMTLLQQEFEMSGLSLTGTIPPSLGSLTQLQSSFNLLEVGLSGTIPPSLGSLTSVQSVFVLRGCGLTGTIPPSLSSLSAGELFAIQDMAITGTIPSALGSMRRMNTALALESLLLTGTIPSSLGSLTTMKSAFALDFLQLTGTVPPSLGHLSELAYQLWIQGTQLTGSLPMQLHQLTSLTGMYVSDNSFSGEVNLPCSVNRFGQSIQLGLVELDLSMNNFSEVDIGIDNHADLCLNPQIVSLVNISHNPITGTVPIGLGSFTSLETLDLSSCLYTGQLPSSLASLSNLRNVDISNNFFSRELPRSLCAWDVANFSRCNIGNQTVPSIVVDDDDDDTTGWNCRAMTYECAAKFTQYCNAGPWCLDTCAEGFCKPQELVWPLIAVGSAIVVVAIIVVLHYVNKRRRKKRISEHRQNMTMMLLKDYVEVDELQRVLLPTGSVDFSHESPCVAAGAAGRVYKCTAVSQINARLQLKQTVALKEIYAMEMIGDKVAITEFAKELTVLMKLHHENIVNFLGVYFHSDIRDGLSLNRYFMVTQFAENGSLDLHIQKDFSEITLQQRQDWVREIALALQYLHREKFVHRDIKPNNVLMSGDWHCLLADFGIARSTQAQQTVDNLTTKIGTVQFMPPEALNNSSMPPTLEHAKAWDAYSFAILVAVVFMRDRVPYAGMDNRAVMVQVLVHGLRPSRPTVLSDEYMELLAVLWNEDPALRPSFDMILDRLDSLQGNEYSSLGQAYLQKPAATEVRNAVQGGGATGPVDGSADSTANSSIDSLGAVGEKTRRPKPRARTVGIEDLKLAQLQKAGLGKAFR